MDVKALNEEVVELDEVLYQLEQDMEVRVPQHSFPQSIQKLRIMLKISESLGVLGTRHNTIDCKAVVDVSIMVMI